VGVGARGIHTCTVIPDGLGFVLFVGLGRLPLGLALVRELLLLLLGMHQYIDLQGVLLRPVLQGAVAHAPRAPLREALHSPLQGNAMFEQCGQIFRAPESRGGGGSFCGG